MKKALLVLAASLLAAPAQADITHKIQSSVSLSVDGAGSVAIRQPSSMAVSGSNVTLGTAPTLLAPLLPELLSVTLLAITALPLLVMLSATAKAIQKETMSQRFYQQQSPPE